MGAPSAFARERHVAASVDYLIRAIEVLKSHEFEQTLNTTLISREPIGVVDLIKPWNWPLNQIACKQGGPSACNRMHNGAEAERGRASFRAHLRGIPRRSRRTSWRLQHRQR